MESGKDDIASLLAQAFTRSEQAEAWLATPNFCLNFQRPKDVLNTPEGIEQVRELLGGVIYGHVV